MVNTSLAKAGFVMLAVLGAAGTGWGADNNYQGPLNGNWQVGPNWSLGVPAVGQNVRIVNNAMQPLTVTYNGIGLATLDQLLIDSVNGGARATLQHLDPAFTLNTAAEIIGASGVGEHDQFLGTVSVVGTLTLGQNADSYGTYVMGTVTGSPQLTTNGLIVGDSGTGQFTQYNGFNQGVGGALTIGRQPGILSSYTLGIQGATGSPYPKLKYTGGDIVGDGGMGALIQYSGTHESYGLALAAKINSKGWATLAGGTLHMLAGIEQVGGGGIGRFLQTGGENDGNIVVGNATDHDQNCTDLEPDDSVNSLYDLKGGILNGNVTVDNAIFRYVGGTLNGNTNMIEGKLVTSGTAGTVVTFHGDVTISNKSCVEVKGGDPAQPRATVIITGKVNHDGIWYSDPADNYLHTVEAGSSAAFIGGVGDRFFIEKDFLSASTAATTWNTTSAELHFIGGGLHHLDVNGIDLGIITTGGVDNFGWGVLELAAGDSLVLQNPSSANLHPALYVDELILDGGIGSLADLSGSGIVLYYNGNDPANAYLNEQSYILGGTGGLVVTPSPEPATLSLLALGGLAVLRRRRR